MAGHSAGSRIHSAGLLRTTIFFTSFQATCRRTAMLRAHWSKRVCAFVCVAYITHTNVCIRKHLYIHMYICIYTYTHVYIYICVCRCIYVHRCSNNVFDEAFSVRSLRAVGGQESFVGLSTGLIESQFCVMLGPAAAGTRLATTAPAIVAQAGLAR